MTLREEMFEYLQIWTANKMHEGLKIPGNKEERDACFLVNGFAGKMDMLQHASNEIFHSTMMNLNYGGGKKGDFKYATFELYMNAREPDYANAQGLAAALDRAQNAAEAFVRDLVSAHKDAKKNHTMGLAFWIDVDDLNWDTTGPFGDGWESVVLHVNVVMPFNYC